MGQEVVVGVLEVFFYLGVAVVSVDVGEGDGAAELDGAVEDVGLGLVVLPVLEELVAGGFDGVGELVSAECVEVLDAGLADVVAVLAEGDAAVAHGCVGGVGAFELPGVACDEGLVGAVVSALEVGDDVCAESAEGSDFDDCAVGGHVLYGVVEGEDVSVVDHAGVDVA